jgi:hypothetical protein
VRYFVIEGNREISENFLSLETFSTMADAKSTKEKMAERMAKLKNLHGARNEARNHNHNEVKKEMER